jgi:type IV secretory system conjugative DNA transfer VirD4/TraG family protein
MANGPTKITVEGEIQLGTELQLIRQLANQSDQGKVVIVRSGGARRNLQGRRPLERRNHTGIEQEELVYSFEKEKEQIFIKNQGMCQTYGIFGVPGCGKTYLLEHLLNQIVAHKSSKPDLKFGGLILDPKGALINDIRDILSKANREDDLIVINEKVMRDENILLNILDSFLEPMDLGKAMSMAAISAGISSKEPYWMNELGTIFGAGIELLDLVRPHHHRVPTLFRLAELLLGEVESHDDQDVVTNLEACIEDANFWQSEWKEIDVDRFKKAKGILRRFKRSKDYNVLCSFIDQSYGLFREAKFKMFSEEVPPDTQQRNIYDSAINDGKFILVSVSKRSLAISKILCTLIKTLFQQTVLTRLDRFQDGELSNFKRPLLFLADEYSDVATEIEGHPMGDGLFFSQMRQFGCMGLVATQSLHMLENSGLGKAWESIFANMSAKIFMQLGDVKTAEEASKLVGESEYRFQSYDRTVSKDGSSITTKVDLKDKKDLPTKVVLQTLGRGQAVVVGALDGKTRPVTRFIHVDGRD